MNRSAKMYACEPRHLILDVFLDGKGNVKRLNFIALACFPVVRGPARGHGRGAGLTKEGRCETGLRLGTLPHVPVTFGVAPSSEFAQA